MLIFFLQLLTAETKAQISSLFLIAGQSNAVGQGDNAKNNKYENKYTFEYDGIKHLLKPLKDPMGQIYNGFEIAKTGSVGPAFASTYSALTKSNVCMLMAARGGSSCCVKAELDNYGTWDKSGELLNFTIEKVKRAEELTQTPLSGIIWMQGERDANAINDKKQSYNDFKKSLKSVIKRFRTSLNYSKLPFYIVQTGYQSGRPAYGNDMVRKAQLEMTKHLKNVFIVYSETNTFFDKKWMKDHVHYDQEGLNNIGETAASKIYKLNFPQNNK